MMCQLLKKTWSAFLVCAIPALATHVAVLETTAASGVITLEEKQYLTDVLRSEAVKILPAEQNYVIMTRENINMMLPPGKAIEDCEGSCLVETGKNISADYIAQGHVGRFANNLTITVELYETAGNKLMGSFSGKASNIEALEMGIRKKSQELFSRIVANTFGTLDLQPVLAPKVGDEQDLVIKVDGEATQDGHAFARGQWKIPPGTHSIEFTHGCYQPLKFNVNILSNTTTEIKNVLNPITGQLSLKTKYNGTNREVPVYVNGEMMGLTPLKSQRVPVCATIEVGLENSREVVPFEWNGKDKLNLVYKLKKVAMSPEELRVDSLRNGKQASADSAAKKALETEEKTSFKTPVSIVLYALGAVSLGLGLYENMVGGRERDKYDKATYSKESDYDNQWDKVQSAKTMRNVFYGVGAGLIAAGTVVVFVF